jgi:hypothetical protein
LLKFDARLLKVGHQDTSTPESPDSWTERHLDGQVDGQTDKRTQTSLSKKIQQTILAVPAPGLENESITFQAKQMKLGRSLGQM